jgi:CRISPR-associated endonuclease Cas1 subtype II
MGWRTVLIRERCSLSYKLDYLTIKYPGSCSRVFLDEIDCLIIESCSTFLNSGLVNELTRRKIAVVFCDQNHNPASQLLALNGSFDARRKIVEQIAWTDECKAELWARIVSEKVSKQGEVLKWLEAPKADWDKLFKLSTMIQPGDILNREAQAARHYFARVFGHEYNRKDTDCLENSALNYGYAILLSIFNRAVVANGYLTQLGIHHVGKENAFNLSCDLMEPFRPIIDRHIMANRLWELNPTTKLGIVDVINTQILVEGEKQYLTNAIAIYCKDCLDALCEGKIESLTCYEFV